MTRKTVLAQLFCKFSSSARPGGVRLVRKIALEASAAIVCTQTQGYNRTLFSKGVRRDTERMLPHVFAKDHTRKYMPMGAEAVRVNN